MRTQWPTSTMDSLARILHGMTAPPMTGHGRVTAWSRLPSLTPFQRSSVEGSWSLARECLLLVQVLVLQACGLLLVHTRRQVWLRFSQNQLSQLPVPHGLPGSTFRLAQQVSLVRLTGMATRGRQVWRRNDNYCLG